MDPPLTSVNQPTQAMGRAMTRALLEEIGDGGLDLPRLVLPTELVRRASS
jgi:DNA-binding LacI/PurR family transcriptional regulator